MIPKQRIKRQFTGERKDLLDEVIWHPSCWVPACRKHHGDFDNHVFRIPRSALPQGVEIFAEALGMAWSLEADFGVRA
ncbi:hypothetical protein NBH00_05295 [Paraconexibacter antarcticus]|uniref:HNH endonuclease n=1 Tax=Paraconexibacter antarcticus TaxID=2949664 RepID=A0ABY5DWX3_9ACTN|nr:hypothetical protein [Paraconexibacter antarcticus]UTI65626.1 hypothetical protein NBH00_05295 [Paraconexibacter antarcticus]